MAKQATKSARNQAQTYAGQVETRTGQDVRGGGAFGPTGLSGDRSTAVGQQQQDLSSAYGGIQKAQTTGGFDPATLDKLTNAYSDMYTTGGFSDADKARYMRQATSGVPAIYDALSQEAQRNKSLTGGLGTGGEISQLARQMSQEQAKAATGGLVGLNQQINQNKLAALGGGSSLAGEQARGVGQANAQMSQLFDAQTGQVNQLGNQILAQYGLQDAADETKLKILAGLSQAPGVLGNIQQGIGQVGSIATGIAGLGAMVP